MTGSSRLFFSRPLSSSNDTCIGAKLKTLLRKPRGRLTSCMVYSRMALEQLYCVHATLITVRCAGLPNSQGIRMLTSGAKPAEPPDVASVIGNRKGLDDLIWETPVVRWGQSAEHISTR